MQIPWMILFSKWGILLLVVVLIILAFCYKYVRNGVRKMKRKYMIKKVCTESKPTIAVIVHTIRASAESAAQLAFNLFRLAQCPFHIKIYVFQETMRHDPDVYELFKQQKHPESLRDYSDRLVVRSSSLASAKSPGSLWVWSEMLSMVDADFTILCDPDLHPEKNWDMNVFKLMSPIQGSVLSYVPYNNQAHMPVMERINSRGVPLTTHRNCVLERKSPVPITLVSGSWLMAPSAVLMNCLQSPPAIPQNARDFVLSSMLFEQGVPMFLSQRAPFVRSKAGLRKRGGLDRDLFQESKMKPVTETFKAFCDHIGIEKNDEGKVSVSGRAIMGLSSHPTAAEISIKYGSQANYQRIRKSICGEGAPITIT